MKNFRILLVASTALLTANFALAQTWTLTSAPTNVAWGGVASSADGTKLVAVTYGLIFTSTDSGANWTSNYFPAEIGSPICVASSADGCTLAAAGSMKLPPPSTFTSGLLWISTNSGTTWISNSALNVAWSSLAFSADGTELVALDSKVPIRGIIFISTNSGITWTSTNTDEYWESVASSADGTKLVAGASGFIFMGSNYVGGTYTSTNSGSSWTLVNSSLSASAIASSADGTKLTAIMGRSIYVSADSGVTWTITSAPATNWVSIASSADGSRLVVVAALLDNIGPLPPGGPSISGLIYSSTNSGTSWVSNSVPVENWVCVVSSADGCKLFAADYGDWSTNTPPTVDSGIWISQSTPAPQMNITPADGNLTLSWLVPSTNFVMQQSSDLSSWTDMTDAPVLNLTNLQNEVTLPMTGNNAFYRLKTP